MSKSAQSSNERRYLSIGRSPVVWKAVRYNIPTEGAKHNRRGALYFVTGSPRVLSASLAPAFCGFISTDFRKNVIAFVFSPIAS